MKRVNVKLGDLRANPYKKEIAGGRIDPSVVAQIGESASKTSFWEQWVVRKSTKGDYELAFGHHRLAAAIALYGKDYTVSVQLEDYSDEQMLIALADENAGDSESIEAQVDVVRVARTYLKAHPASCKALLHCATVPRSKFADKESSHEHGSVRCLMAFLGKNNWGEKKVNNLVSIADRLDGTLLKHVVSGGATHPERKGLLSEKSAVAISGMETDEGKPNKEAQRQVVAAIATANRDLKSFQKAEVSKRTESKLPCAAVKDMGTYIPAEVVKAAVKAAEDLPAAKQAASITAHIKREVQNRKEHAVLASVPDADRVVSKVIAQLFQFPHDETMRELLAGKENLSQYSLKNLFEALERHINRITLYKTTLVSASPKRLTTGKG